MSVSAIGGIASSVTAITQSRAASGTSGTSASTTGASSAYKVPYASPVQGYDTATGATILKYLDTKTGQTLYQDPSQAALLYQRTQKRHDQPASATSNSPSNGAPNGAQRVSITG
jgi:hypothetical protein